MKKFFVKGDTANWLNLNVDALNLQSGCIETTTAIPENKGLKVTLMDGFDTNCPDIDAVSMGASGFASRHGKRRQYLLLNAGRVVGWAAFHRKATERKVHVVAAVEWDTTIRAKSDAEATRLAVEQGLPASLNGYEGEVLYATAENE